MKIKAILFSVFTLLLLSACSNPKKIDTAVGLYGSAPVKQDVGSDNQVIDSRNIEYTYEEALRAWKQALNIVGAKTEQYDSSKGMLTGIYREAIQYAHTYTFAIYIQEVDSKPTTKITIITDEYTGIFFGAPRHKGNILASKFYKEFYRILATY